MPSQLDWRLFGKRRWGITAVLVAIFLLPTLFFPLGPDESLFHITAQKIIYQGAVHYRDIVEVKPPAIYYLYAVAILLFGDHECSIRILDFILQLSTCLVLVATTRKATGNDLLGAISAVLYALLYTSLGYQSTAQPESYAPLLTLVVIRMLMFRRSSSGFLIAGIAVGGLFSFKFTLAILLLVIPLSDWLIFHLPLRQLWRNALWGMLGFVSVAALLPLYLTLFNAWDGFMLVQEYLRGYVALNPASPEGIVKQMNRSFGDFLSSYCTVLVGAMLVLGIAQTLRPVRNYHWQKMSTLTLLRIAFICFVLMLLALIVEGKYIPYHYARLFGPLPLLSAWGAMWMVLQLRLHLRFGTSRVVIAGVVAAALCFSPFVRCGWYMVPMMFRITGNEAGFDQFYSDSQSMWSRLDQKSTANFILHHQRQEDNVVVAAMASGSIYMMTGRVPQSSVYSSLFFKAPFAPACWRDTIQQELLTIRPRFIVAETRDSTGAITGTNISALEALCAIPAVDSLLNSTYSITFQNNHYTVFERR